MMSRGVPGHDESRWLLKALREAAHELESQLWGVDDEALRWRPSEDAWSLKEITAHLRDCEAHFVECLERITFERAPRLARFDGDALVLERDYRRIDVEAALAEFALLRERAVTLLWTSAGEWERTGQHPYLGDVTIAQLAHEQNEHDLEHLWQVRRIREGLSVGAGSSR